MDTLLASKSLPPGFRFHPTDEELFMYYLKRKVLGKSLNPKMISDLDVYRYGPWDLPSKSYLKTKDLNWYFFCPRAKKYSNGGRTNRSTEHGYWKSTGNDRMVKYNNRPIGKIKTLIFHMGKPPGGDRTDWVMHEYRLEDKALAEKGIPLDSFVICKVYKKSGLGPKNGENYGAPFVEEEWDNSDDDENVGTISTLLPHPVTTTEGCGGVVVNENPTTSIITNTNAIHAATPFLPITPVEIEEDELDRMLAMFTDSPPPTRTSVAPDGDGDDDFFAGLDDIAGVYWSRYFAENRDGFVELNDLL